MSEIERRASDADRERTGLHLRDAAADGRLTIDELDERLELAYTARTMADLDRLTRDLGTLAPASAPGPRRRRLVAVMSGAALAGRVRLGSVLRVLAVMGGVEIDLRDAELVDGELTIRVFALMGGVSLVVPPGVDVDVHDVIAFMGGRGSNVPAAPAGAPRVRVTGFVMMAGLAAVVRQRRTPKLPAGSD
jgi:hypothetical protein